LAEAHDAGIIHRDLKPENILLCRTREGKEYVKVLDFGLVTVKTDQRTSDAKLTADGIAGGTPAYMPPEMIQNREKVDGRADIYALGCVAYWLLTGHAPFERETAMATIIAHLDEEPAPPSSLTEIDIPVDLETAILDCLAKEPGDRPASAADLARRLDAAVPGERWDQGRAARWWEAHKPSTERAEPVVSRKPTPRIGRIRRGSGRV
jgi:serine/threonine-protein kinase